MLVELTNKYATDVVWLSDSPNVEEYVPEYRKMQVEEDKTYGIIQRYLSETFPDFTWETRTFFQTGYHPNVVTRFEGRYESLQHTWYDGVFIITIKITRGEGKYYTNTNATTGGDHYQINYEFRRDDKPLPIISAKLHSHTDGHDEWGHWNPVDDGARCFKVKWTRDANDNQVIDEPTDLVKWFKELCTYRAKLTNKYVEADKAARKAYNAVHTSFDIETMEYSTKIAEIAKKYCMPIDVHVENESDKRTYFIELNNGRFGIVARPTHAEIYIADGYVHSSHARSGDVAAYYIRLVHLAVANILQKCPLDDPRIFELFDALCSAYYKVWGAYLDVVQDTKKYNGQTDEITEN